MRRNHGNADPFTLLFLGVLVVTYATGHSTLVYSDLKSGPTDARELYALGVCFAAGCTSQFAYLLSRVGVGAANPWARWVGEVLLGGVSAYMSSVAYLRYGPPAELPTLIVVAAVAGFAGQRLLVVVIEYALKKLGVSALPPLPPASPPKTGDADEH